MTKISRRSSHRTRRQTLREEVQEIFERMGGAKKISEQLTEFRLNDDFFASNRKALLVVHPNEWVAASKGKKVGHGKYRTALLKRLLRQGFDTSSLVIRFVDTKPRHLILLEAA